ncbi:hypothetical protein [Streptomyces violascens]|uniref:hypothetical protein n=1 Tax=Streptomyces violascens TaxID=67381 RepID=UPI00368F8C93
MEQQDTGGRPRVGRGAVGVRRLERHGAADVVGTVSVVDDGCELRAAFNTGPAFQFLRPARIAGAQGYHLRDGRLLGGFGGRVAGLPHPLGECRQAICEVGQGVDAARDAGDLPPATGESVDIGVFFGGVAVVLVEGVALVRAACLAEGDACGPDELGRCLPALVELSHVEPVGGVGADALAGEAAGAFGVLGLRLPLFPTGPVDRARHRRLLL